MIVSTKGERHIELNNDPLSIKEKRSSAHLPFKNRFVFFETGSISTSSCVRSNGENETLPLMDEEAFCENLDKHSITSSQHAQHSRECYDYDANLSFRHQIFEDNY